MLHPTQTEVFATAPRAARALSSLAARNDGRKENGATCQSDFPIRNRLARAVVAPAFPGSRTLAAREAVATDKRRTRFGWRCGRLRGLILRAWPASPTTLLRRVDLETVQKVFQCSWC